MIIIFIEHRGNAKKWGVARIEKIK